MKDHVYGRGKFPAHQNYIEYMSEIVSHPNYQNMPNAKSPDGRINWQVSSGKTTSFYKDYLARRDWWIKTADALGLPGKDDDNDRFTVTARLIHPTGYRVCRLCGQRTNVGYFYLNSLLTNRLNRDFPSLNIYKIQPISEALNELSKIFNVVELQQYLCTYFPERACAFQHSGPTTEAFERTRHLRSQWLSPGFMGNPPDRLDGFHDYDLKCRKANDPGRSDDNMRSYNHDRRSFEWWAEGNWAMADALYNSAGSGICSVAGCEEKLERISPDHVGPLACGFKQLTLFSPTCQSCNSAKNRRFSYSDVCKLIDYEIKSHDSVASWQVRAHWNKYKILVKDDRQTKAFSNSLRSLQDFYLRTLWELYKAGQVRLLASFLHPEYALQNYEFIELDTSNLSFKEVHISENNSKLRKRLAARTVRIAFEALTEYCSKPIERRKMVREDFIENSAMIGHVVGLVAGYKTDNDVKWIEAFQAETPRALEANIADLIEDIRVLQSPADQYCRALIQNLFDHVGTTASIDFSRYEDIL